MNTKLIRRVIWIYFWNIPALILLLCFIPPFFFFFLLVGRKHQTPPKICFNMAWKHVWMNVQYAALVRSIRSMFCQAVREADKSFRILIEVTIEVWCRYSTFECALSSVDWQMYLFILCNAGKMTCNIITMSNRNFRSRKKGKEVEYNDSCKVWQCTHGVSCSQDTSTAVSSRWIVVFTDTARVAATTTTTGWNNTGSRKFVLEEHLLNLRLCHCWVLYQTRPGSLHQLHQRKE